MFHSVLATLLVAAGSNAYSHPNISTALSQSYAPVHVNCPDNVQWIRPATGLSRQEAKYVRGRKAVVTDALESYLERLRMEDFDVSKYIELIGKDEYSNAPVLGMAISGGGWASAFTGIGAFRALDDRLDEAVQQRTGGLAQSLTYLSGLSGGAWPVLSLALNDFPTADDLVDLWEVGINRLVAGNDTEYTLSPKTIFKDIAAKAKAGFPVSFLDYLGLAIASEFFPGLDTLVSDIVHKTKFKSHQMPFPILQFAEIDDDDVAFFNDVKLPHTNATIYDLTPFEFGAWTGVKAFSPLEYLGTTYVNGQPSNKSACVRGFDRASFIAGTTSGGFNFWYTESLSNGSEGNFAKRQLKQSRPVHAGEHDTSLLPKRETTPLASLSGLVETLGQTFQENVSTLSYAYYPNPFAGLASSTPPSAQEPLLRLVDGSESGQALPLWGQIQPARALDFIIAWDDNQDTNPYQWNNGTNLYNTYLSAKTNGLAFPVIPSANTFVNRNYTTSPVFFGCDANLTTNNDASAPIVLYFADAPYSAYENYSFTQASFSKSQINDIFVNSFNEVTQGNGTLDQEWPVCLGCAAIDRSLDRVGMQRSAQCERCLQRYCWDGVEDNSPAPVVDPSLVLDPELGFVQWNKTHDY